ncbi:MAG: hypothetical protein M3R10_08690, partial [Verrucomicrobiota bacterium]|nr:hypothetical protein [Verrucomicrobiota bacterium]
MLAPKRNKSQSEIYSPLRKETETACELKFITELGRSLLFTVHPKKVALRVAEAVGNATKADVCAVVVELEHIGLVNCAFSAEINEFRQDFLNKSRFKQWLNFLPPQISFWAENENELLLTGGSHKFEYISPLHINGDVKGALIAGFAEKTDCAESAQQ